MTWCVTDFTPHSSADLKPLVSTPMALVLRHVGHIVLLSLPGTYQVSAAGEFAKVAKKD